MVHSRRKRLRTIRNVRMRIRRTAKKARYMKVSRLAIFLYFTNEASSSIFIFFVSFYFCGINVLRRKIQVVVSDVLSA